MRQQKVTYRVASGTTRKADSDDHGPMGRGPLLGCDPRPLTSDGVRVISTGSCPTYGSLRPSARDSPTGATTGRPPTTSRMSTGRQSAPQTARTARRRPRQARPPPAASPALAQVPSPHECSSAPRTARLTQPRLLQAATGPAAPLRGAVTASASTLARQRRPRSPHATSTQEPPHTARPPAPP